MLKIGDVTFNLSKAHVNDEGCQVILSIESTKYRLSGTFLSEKGDGLTLAISNIANPEVASTAYKSLCEDFVLLKEPYEDECSIVFDFCIDSKDHDITNRAVISCGVESNEITLNEELFSTFCQSV